MAGFVALRPAHKGLSPLPAHLERLGPRPRATSSPGSQELVPTKSWLVLRDRSVAQPHVVLPKWPYKAGLLMPPVQIRN